MEHLTFSNIWWITVLLHSTLVCLITSDWTGILLQDFLIEILIYGSIIYSMSISSSNIAPDHQTAATMAGCWYVYFKKILVSFTAAATGSTPSEMFHFCLESIQYHLKGLEIAFIFLANKCKSSWSLCVSILAQTLTFLIDHEHCP